VPRFALALLALVLLLPLAGAKLGAPVLTVGDFFEIRDTIGSDHSPTQSRTFRDTVEARETIVVNGTSYDAVRIGTTFVGAQGAGQTIQRWVRASDGASIRERASITVGNRTEVSESTYDPPCAQVRFPLDVGDAWTTSCVRTQGGASTRVNASYRVVRQERVRVPAGTFDAFVIEVAQEGSGSTAVQTWQARETCGLAKAYSAQPGYNDTYELMAYRCASVEKRDAPGLGAWVAAAALLLTAKGQATFPFSRPRERPQDPRPRREAGP